MRKTALKYLSMLLFTVAGCTTQALESNTKLSDAAAVCYWLSEPAGTNEAVYLQGYNLDANAKIEIASLNNANPSGPIDKPNYSTLDFKPVESISSSGNSTVFMLPGGKDKYKSYAMRITRDRQISGVKIINSPQIWWTQGTLGSGSTQPGKWIIISGLCLNFDDNARAVLRADDGSFSKLIFVEGSMYSVKFSVPGNVKKGNYDLYVHNGLGGWLNWSQAQNIKISSSPFSSDTVYDIIDYVPADKKDFGRTGNPFSIVYEKMCHVDPENDRIFARAIRDVARKGGGIISIPQGHFFLSKTLELPPNVRLRGQGRDMTILNWSDHDKPLYALIAGTINFGVEDMTLYVGNHLNGIAVKGKRLEDRGNAYFRRLNIRMDPVSPKTKRYFTPEQVRENYNDRIWLGDKGNYGDRSAALRLSGKNLEISDCVIMTNPAVWEAIGIFLERAQGVYVNNNEVLSSFRASVYINGVEDLVFTENDITGGTFIGTHHTVVEPREDFPPYDLGDGSFAVKPFYHQSSKKNYYLNTAVRNMFFSKNTYRYSLLCDSEVMTLDSHYPLGIYYGTIKKVDGSTTWLKEETEHPPKFGERWPDLNYWRGAGLYILDGKGAGQYRILQYGSKGREIKLDRPWDVEPDETSRVSIAKFHGRLIYEKNRYRDCGVFQFWGGGLENIVDSNKYVRNAGVVTYAGQVYNGLMPDWYNQFLGNVLSGSGDIGSMTYDYTEDGVKYGRNVRKEPYPYKQEDMTGYTDPDFQKDKNIWGYKPVYKGPISRGLIHRNNTHHTGDLMIKGGVDGAVVQGNTARQILTDVKAGLAEPENVFERNNISNP